MLGFSKTVLHGAAYIEQTATQTACNASSTVHQALYCYTFVVEKYIIIKLGTNREMKNILQAEDIVKFIKSLQGGMVMLKECKTKERQNKFQW